MQADLGKSKCVFVERSIAAWAHTAHIPLMVDLSRQVAFSIESFSKSHRSRLGPDEPRDRIYCIGKKTKNEVGNEAGTRRQ